MTELRKKTEQFFVGLESREAELLRERKRIEKRVTNLLTKNAGKQLSRLVDELQEGAARTACTHYADMRRLFLICRIIRLEIETGEELFSTGVYNFDELLKKYQRTIYALRRLEWIEDTKAWTEGIEFLRRNRISISAMLSVLKEEIFIHRVAVVCRCADLFAGLEEEKQLGLLLGMLEEKPKEENILLRIAAWSIDKGDFESAYRYLERINNPDETIQQLIREVEEYVGKRK